MSPKQAALAAAAKLKIEIDGVPDEFGLTVDSPVGFIFAASGCHCCVSAKWPGQTSTDVWRRMARDLKDGLQPCDRGPDCEICCG